MRRRTGRRGRKMHSFDSGGYRGAVVFFCLPAFSIRAGGVGDASGRVCLRPRFGLQRVASMSDSRPELRSSVGSRPALSQEGSTKSVQIIIPSVIDILAN